MKPAYPPQPSNPALADADTTSLTFVSSKAEITVPVTTCKLERTIEGASSLTPTIHDPIYEFLNSPAIAVRAPAQYWEPEPMNAAKDGRQQLVGVLDSVVAIDNLVWRLAGVNPGAQHLIEAALEEEAVWLLRQNFKPLTISRGQWTRAQFIVAMFNESGVPIVCPEIDIKQPIETTQEAETLAQKGRKRKPGFSAHAKLTVKQKAADSEQRQNLELAFDVAASHAPPERATLALVCAIIQENVARGPNILQLEASTAAGDGVDPSDVAAVCALFLTKGYGSQGGAIALAKAHPSWTPGEIAVAVQAPASKDPAPYQVWAAEAREMLQSFSGENAEALQPTATYPKEYTFKRGGPNGELEDSWTCARRLAEEVNWYLFIDAGVGYLFSGEQLLKAAPQMLVAPGADGMILLPTGGYWNTPQYESNLTVTCQASVWQAPPGSVAEVEGYGPFDGRWIVKTITRENMRSTVTQLVLVRPQHKKREPAHELLQRSGEAPKEGQKGTALDAYEAAQALSALKIPYPPGDVGDTGHAPGEIGKDHPAFLDCSASTCYVLYRAGMFNSTTAVDSGELAKSWSLPGKGKEMTVWANGEHVFIAFTIPGKPHSRLDTVSPGDVGARLQPFSPLPEGSTELFTPRHWPGQ
jgi:hypothetical protein